MGGFCTPSYETLPEQDVTIEGTEIPEWVAAAGRTIFSRAAEVADSPFPNFEGERQPSFDGYSFTADERAGQEILRSGAENYLPYMNRASDIANTLGGGYDSLTRQELLGTPYSGATREQLMGDYQGATREELMGDPFSLETAQPFMDISISYGPCY